MALIALTQTSSGSAFNLNDSDLIKFYNRGTQTVIEYVVGENGIRKAMDVDESTTVIEAASTKIITTSMGNQYLFLNSERVISTDEVNSLAVVTYDNAGDAPEILKLDVTEAVFLASIPAEAPAGYTVFTVLWTQVGTADPTYIQLKNTTPYDWEYKRTSGSPGTFRLENGAGNYLDEDKVILTGDFVQKKNPLAFQFGTLYDVIPTGENEGNGGFYINTATVSAEFAAVLADDLVSKCYMEVRINN